MGGLRLSEAAAAALFRRQAELRGEAVPVEAAAKRSKYHARRSTCGAGHDHASGREARRCDGLRLLEKAGEISGLEIEPVYYFEVNGRPLLHDNGRRAGYKPDFRYTRTADGVVVVEDAKGVSVRDWPLRKALFRALHPDVELREV